MFGNRQVIKRALGIVASIMIVAPAVIVAQNTFPATGNVGIGTTSPAVPLDISGYLHVGGSSTPATGAQGAYLGWNALTGGTGETDFINNQGGGLGGFAFMNTPTSGAPLSTLAFITGSGSFGIGTNSPRVGLDVTSGSATTDGMAARLSAENGDVNVVLGEVLNGGSNAGALQVYSGGSGGNLGSNHYVLDIQPYGGNVGIGTSSPGAKLEVDGSVKLTSGSGASLTYADGTTQSTAWTGVLCGGDYAEAMNVSGSKAKYQPGDVLVLASDDSDDVQKSADPYSTMVAGIYATKPGVIGRRAALANSTNDVPMAMVGVVPTKVTAENGPIHRGDLLVSSSTPGYAMKGTDRARLVGAVIGKAMGTLTSGTGTIEVLVTLQ